MAAVPIIEEMSGSPAGAMIASLAGLRGEALDQERAQLVLSSGTDRRLAIYAASAGFDLVEELDFLCLRTVEPNIFFNPRFLAPAMPRLEDREVRLAVIRDGDEDKNRLRMLMPFSVERPSVPIGVPIIRTWSSPFGPVGTPLIDRDDPVGVIDDFLSMLARPHLKLPGVLVLPDMRLDGAAARVIRAAALGRNLTVIETDRVSRPFLESDLDGEAYLRETLRSHHVREFRRLKRRLGEHGVVEHVVARQPEEVRLALEEFLTLESSGWKGRERSALAVDRFRAPFAREAIHRLAQRDLCRIHSLTLDGKTIASLVVFVEQGVAYTWKTAYDETYAAYSPGTLLVIEITHRHLDDPNIAATDSCAVADHPVMSRIWRERREMGTLVIGLTPAADRQARQVAGQIHLYRETREFARRVRTRLRSLLRRR